MNKTLLLDILTALSTGIHSSADSPRVHDHLFNWKNPERVSVSDKNPIFNDPHTGHAWNQSHFYTVRLDNGKAFSIILFYWVFRISDNRGYYVLLARADSSVHLFDRKIRDPNAYTAKDHFLIRFDGGRFESIGNTHRIQFKLEDFKFDLPLYNILPPRYYRP